MRVGQSNSEDQSWTSKDSLTVALQNLALNFAKSVRKGVEYLLLNGVAPPPANLLSPYVTPPQFPPLDKLSHLDLIPQRADPLVKERRDKHSADLTCSDHHDLKKHL